MPTLTVEGYGAFEAAEGESLLELCEQHDVPMDSACGGFACCNSCRVVVIAGGEHLSDRLPEEEPFLDGPDQRLGCQATLRGEVAVRLAPGL